jgi:FrmR/RcnR family transcriptional regulator, repressor of frmRAB operon
MAHTIKDKKRLLHRVRRIRGQIEAVERALSEERDCFAVLQLITACRGAVGGLMSEVLEGHIREHILDPNQKRNPGQNAELEQLIKVLHTYLR